MWLFIIDIGNLQIHFPYQYVVLFGKVNPTGVWSKLNIIFSWILCSRIICPIFLFQENVSCSYKAGLISFFFLLFFLSALANQAISKHSEPILLIWLCCQHFETFFLTTSIKLAISNCYYHFPCNYCFWYTKVTRNRFYFAKHFIRY